MTADKTQYYLINELKAWENDNEVFHKKWEDKMERDLT